MPARPSTANGLTPLPTSPGPALSPVVPAVRRVLWALLATAVVLEGLAAASLCPPPHAVAAYVFLQSGTFPFFHAACLAALVVFWIHWPDRVVAARLTLSALAVELGLLGWRLLTLPNMSVVEAFQRAGLPSLLAVTAALLWWRRRSSHGPLATSLLALVWVLPLYVLLSVSLLWLTGVLHPAVYDAHSAVFDAGYGTQLGITLAAVMAHIPGADVLLSVVYDMLPVALVVTVAYDAGPAGQPRSPHTLVSVVLLGAVGYALYHAFPAVGPRYVFDAVPDVATITLDRVHPIEPARNCLPSLHTAWALLIWLRSGSAPRLVRALLRVFASLTIVATVGLGYHYLADLFMAVPFTLGLLGLQRAVVSDDDRLFRRAAWTLGGSVVLIALPLLLAAWLQPQSLPVRVAVTAAWSLGALALGGRWLWSAVRAPWPADASGVPSEPGAESVTGPAAPVTVRASYEERSAVIALCLSGFAGLVYEIAFAKHLALTFGSTARASIVVLATYMGGLALGAVLGGRLAARIRAPLVLYAAAEGFVAVWCFATPWLFGWVRELYVALAGQQPAGSASLTALQVALGALVMLPPTVAMGCTLPALVSAFSARGAAFGPVLSRFYSANTFGAAMGSLLSGYFLLPAFGLSGTMSLAVVFSLVAAAVALRLDRAADSATGGPSSSRPVATGSSQLTLPPPAPKTPAQAHEPGWLAAVAALAIGGVLTFVLEVTMVHLLAVVIGNSAYAFAVMLAMFLIGLTAGAAVARRVLARALDARLGLVVAQVALAVTVLAGVFMWEAIPDYLAALGTSGGVVTFEAREVVRLLLCALLLVPPAMAIGASYPLAMDLATRGAADRVVWLGRLSGLNTLGNITGALLAGFVLLPAFGSLRTLQFVAAMAVGLAVLVALVSRLRVRTLLALTLPVALLAMAQPQRFDVDALTTGANVYFKSQHWGPTIDWAESIDGGLTSVVRSGAADDPTLTLLTNGKFQGDNGLHGEVRSQYGFGLAPLLHTTARGAACVIGLGTGASTRVLADAGFSSVDVAELSPEIVTLAERYFQAVNRGVTRRPNVVVHVADGRNMLLVGQQKYDVIAMEVTSIWFAGAASLYNLEFYQLVKSRLAPNGVLQQWIQLHHVDRGPLVSIVATVRAEFEHVWLYFVDKQGIIVACDGECQPSPAALHLLESTPALADVLAAYPKGLQTFDAARLLSPPQVDTFLTRAREVAGVGAGELVSTDDNLYLEYATPKGNVMDYATSLKDSLQILTRYRVPAGVAPP